MCVIETSAVMYLGLGEKGVQSHKRRDQFAKSAHNPQYNLTDGLCQFFSSLGHMFASIDFNFFLPIVLFRLGSDQRK